MTRPIIRLKHAAAVLAAAAFAISQAMAQVLLRDAEIEEWIEEYSFPLYEAAGLPPEAVEIYLIGDPTPNAAAGQKRMFVHTGLISYADTPNQVQGVLAHETGHLAGNHSTRTADAIAKAGRPAMLSLVIAAAAIAAGAPPEAGMAALGLGQSVGISSFLAYSRGQESAADQAALTYLEDVGASSRGLIEFFDKLADMQLVTARRYNPYLSTHPGAVQRMSALRERAAGSETWERVDDEAEMLRFEMLKAKIAGFMDDPYTTLRRYPLADQGKPARYARAVAYYRMSELDKAQREIDRLIEEEPDNPYFAELKGQMLFEHGLVRDAVEPHRRSVELAPQHALLRINLGRALVATEDRGAVEEAVSVLQVALDMEPDNGFGWSELARAHARLGDETLAALAQAEAFYSWGDLPSAHRFATKAKEGLEPGTPEYVQALDILGASEDAARRARGRGGRGRG
jgi:predicted Zn-dependent protease